MENVNLCFITDDNYVVPTSVTIASIIKNRSNDCNLNIHILTNNLSSDNIRKFHEFEDEMITVDIYDKTEIVNQYNNLDMNRHVTSTAILKFFLPDIFPSLDKILYLDGDIIVQNDIVNLYNVNIDDYYGAVVKDILSITNVSHMKKLNINNPFYFNSGVLLLNLARMRRDDVARKMIDFRINVKQHFMDQDAFNAVIGHNVRFLSYKYNFLNYYLEKLDKKTLSVFFEDKIKGKDKNIYKNCAIVHFGGKEKPWIYNLGYLSELYEKYYKISPFAKEKLNLKRSYSIIEKIFSIKNSQDKKHKIITILGIKLKLRRKNA